MSADAREQRLPVVLHGIGVCPGVVMGPAFVMAPEATYVPDRRLQPADVDHEISRLEKALIETRRQLRSIQQDMEKREVLVDSRILDAHLMVLDDNAFIEEVVGRVRKELRNVESVVKEVADRYAAVLSSLDDAYLRERNVDVKDVARRLIRNLTGKTQVSIAEMARQHIVVAQDLVPSETALFRREKVIGFVTDYGSVTSHTAVMARALAIPAVVGLGDISHRVQMDDEVLIDGHKGLIIIHPSAEQLEQYGRVAEERRNIEQGLRENLRSEPATTPDGRRVTLSANIEGLDELEAVAEYGAEGVGLFRSEYAYLSADRRAVSEMEQAELYTRVAKRVAPASVIIRTLDLGGDKQSPDLPAHPEANPFLGCRSIRLSLQNPETFKIQLRAILRASQVGNVKLMYPMISGVEEVIAANRLLDEAKAELARDGVPFAPDLDVGVMIEIPSAALTADAIAPHVKFFSLGTNDLVQYTLAVDRINERVAYLYKPTHPAVLKLIQQAVAAGHRHGIWVGVCGEMAADPLMTPLLVGLGVDELSMAPAAVPLVKDAIRSIDYARMQEMADVAMGCILPGEVVEHCRRVIGADAPELLALIGSPPTGETPAET
ncbi:MAG: phosphoenolpyruvate--protein phosphotransferase [Verrucomicrobia bacterium]|nr:phosphoenolpyruvate--protein phosphotransferase [Verrucomicrobiota bacterium]